MSFVRETAVDQSEESSAPARRSWVRGWPGENCHVRYWHLVYLKCVVGPPSSLPNYTSGGTKVGEPSPSGQIKIAMAFSGSSFGKNHRPLAIAH